MKTLLVALTAFALMIPAAASARWHHVRHPVMHHRMMVMRHHMAWRGAGWRHHHHAMAWRMHHRRHHG